mmetsp:Transcript_15400/g.17439  ORF Transcript_15400/g.17439 Transcript_15400/m.17439 type:complete len:90 (-) Transcript_15400:146-415(-)
MIGAAVRRSVPTLRNGVARVQRRTLFEGPNPVKEQQQMFQKGSTPYLRGEADPTYLRKGTDTPIAIALLGATAFTWLAVGGFHMTMWGK